MSKLESSIQERLERIRTTIPSHVRLVAVSKFHSIESILEAYHCGQRVFGESREQELRQKHKELPRDIQWHFIGHLQTNKVKYIVPYIHLIESVDSVRLLREIDKQSERIDRTTNCLLEVNISGEEQKYGFTPEDCMHFFESGSWKSYANVRIMGLMGMAQMSGDEAVLRKNFSALHDLFQTIKKRYFPDSPSFGEISMGMSGDYLTAIDEGSTSVRIGSAIFGERL